MELSGTRIFAEALSNPSSYWYLVRMGLTIESEGLRPHPCKHSNKKNGIKDSCLKFILRNWRVKIGINQQPCLQAKKNPLRLGIKKPPFVNEGGFKIGNDILSQALDSVPSALMGLTSLFGMGRGGHHRYSHLKTCSVCAELIS